MELYKKLTIHWNLKGTFSLQPFSYFYYVHILYVYAYFHVYISCLIVHVLLSKIFEIFGSFFIRNSFYSSFITIMIIIYQNEVDFDFQLKI